MHYNVKEEKKTNIIQCKYTTNHVQAWYEYANKSESTMNLSDFL